MPITTSVSAPSSPRTFANMIGSSSTGNGINPIGGPSTISTPALTASAGPTPLLTRVVTPQDELPEFDLPEAAMTEDEAKAAFADEKEKEKEEEKRQEKQLGLPECWGHRGASASFPENTRASFVEACKQGADGIETDIHITSDGVLVLFHDPCLDRTTNGKGRIREQPWYGVLEHVRTKAEPVQPIPQFSEVLALMLEQGNERVKLNLDCKVDNDADNLFKMISEVLSTFTGWEEKLAPRIILGLWHPKFLQPALTHLPFLPRYAISMSLSDSRTYFWPSVHGFSIYYSALSTSAGQAFLAECKKEGKKVCAWTVNGREEMRECVRWGLGSVITDKPGLWREVRAEIIADRQRALRPTLTTYVLPWIKKTHWTWDVQNEAKKEMDYLEKEGGRFEKWKAVDVGLEIRDLGN